MVLISSIKIISIGGVNIDLCANVPKFPGIDEEIEVVDFKELPGGSAANYIVGVARLGVKAGFIGKIGDDYYGQILLKDFKKENVDISQIKIEKNIHSGTCLIPIDKDGNRQIFSFRGANAKLNITDIDSKYIQQASLIHVTSPPKEVAEYVAQLAREYKILFSYDPGGKVIHKGLNFIESVLSNTDIFLPSKSELKILFPELKDPLTAGYQLLNNFGIQIIAIKLGAQGCLIVSDKEEIYAKGFKVKVVDTTGAGDSFAAAFTVAFLKRWNLSKCAEFANAAGALAITQVGARSALPTIHEIEKFLEEKEKFSN
ncbi:MAG: carbohydrate kinase family protein [Candidatus Helarchaeota archaeon]